MLCVKSQGRESAAYEAREQQQQRYKLLIIYII